MDESNYLFKRPKMEGITPERLKNWGKLLASLQIHL